jgi:hypothetical protein
MIAGNPTEPALKPRAADEWFTPGRFALFLALVVAAAFPGILLGSTTFIVRDFGMFSYPTAYFHRQSFWRGELPLWNPFNHCGLPFLAQWNTLTLYPPSLIYLLLPLSWSLSFFCLLHLYWGGLGMYFLAHRWTNHRLAAALAGVIFSFNGLSLNFLMWPSHVATFSWLPWVVWLAQPAWREGGKHMVLGILAAALQMLAGGPETIVFTWLILFALACGDWICRNGPRGKMILRFSGIGLLVALVCAAQLLPFLELLARSQRDSGYSVTTHDWSMPFWGWANFLVPLFRTSPTAQGLFLQNGQYWTSSYYAGIGTVLLVAVAVWRVRDWRVRALAALLLLGMVLALGDGTWLYRGLRFCFPALGFVRYPVKFVILILALAPPLAAFGFAALARDFPRARRFELGCAVAILILIGGIVVVDWRSALPADAWRATWQSGLSRAAFLILILLFSAALSGSHDRRQILFTCLLLMVFWLDLVTHVPTQNPGVNPAVYTPGWTRAQLKRDLQPRLGESRAMLAPAALEVLRYNPLPGLAETYLRNRLAIRVNCNLLDEVPQVDGFFSLTPREAHRLTRLPYDQPDREFPALLDFWAVSQTTLPGSTYEWASRPTAMPIVSAGQRPVFADDNTAFAALSQTNLDLRQIVFLSPEARGGISATQQGAARVLASQFANQKVAIQTEAPAPSLVVISQTYYPAWKAYVDGQPVKLWRANYAFQALQVPAGRHQIELRYEDRTLLIGAILSALGLLACAGLGWWVSFRATPGAAQPDSARQTTVANGRE